PRTRPALVPRRLDEPTPGRTPQRLLRAGQARPSHRSAQSHRSSPRLRLPRRRNSAGPLCLAAAVHARACDPPDREACRGSVAVDHLRLPAWRLGPRPVRRIRQHPRRRPPVRPPRDRHRSERGVRRSRSPPAVRTDPACLTPLWPPLSRGGPNPGDPMTTQTTRIERAVYDALRDFQQTADWPQLRLAQMRQHLAEHIARDLTLTPGVLPADPDGIS